MKMNVRKTATMASNLFPKWAAYSIPEFRECVLELITHEVSAEKVAPVIKSELDMVGAFVSEDLPSRR